MEVEEENTSNHLHESATTVKDESLLENNSSNDKELEKEVSEPSNGEEAEEGSSVTVPKLDDPEPPVAVAETVGIIALESTNAAEDEKHDDEGAVKDDVAPGSEAAALCSASELTNLGKNDGVEDNGVGVVVENVKNNGVDTSTTGDVVADNGEKEEVMEAVKTNDGVDTQEESIRIVQGDEAKTEVQEGVVAEVVKEEGACVAENNEEEASMADGETDEEATMDEDAHLVMETELPARIKGHPRKRKRRGKQSNTTLKAKAVCRKKIEEDVCFICFDGGDLVLCDLKNCPKAYHPSCVNRDEAFFKTKGRWNCGWHLCSICQKKAEYMCYTCTFSLCKACIKTNGIICVREKEKKGFCEACMKTVMLIENGSQENQGNIDFNDKSSWEYLFKDYWTELKEKLDLSLAELLEAKNAWIVSEQSVKQETPGAQSDVKDGGSGSENHSENPEPRKTRRRMANRGKKQEENVNTIAETVDSEDAKNIEWASKELLEFVTHMTNGSKSVKSQFDVQGLLLEYIKTNNLRDSRRKSQIICDTWLQRLFGKPRVGHFEMLKLLESHFLIKDAQIDDILGNMVDTECKQFDNDEADETLTKGGKDRKRRTRRKVDHELQSNRDDYAAIDIHNISLIYLRRKLVEDLLDDSDTFHSKVVGTFVRIRISRANHKHEIYRLVHVTGTTKAAQYKIGERKTNTMLEILNLDKKESIAIDTISNQEFTQDECKRLRQIIKCGLINRLTVGDILDKAMELQVARVNDWLETEVLRLSHLRDRASDLGRKKELRQCVEKLQVLKTRGERVRRLEEFPVINADSTMDPNYVSENDINTEDKKQDMHNSSASSRYSKRRECPLKDSWSGTGTPRSSSNNISNKTFSIKVEDATSSTRLKPHNENIQPQSSESVTNVNQMEKMWHYKDPFGKIQGPFSMVQLCKWSDNKYFPSDLKIWKKIDNEEDGVLLTDALECRFVTKLEMPNLHPTGLGQVGPGGTKGLATSLVERQNSNLVANMVPSVSPQSPQVGSNGWNGGAQPGPWGLQGVAPNQGSRVGNGSMGWGRTGHEGAANQGWVRNGFGGNRKQWSSNRDQCT